MPIGSPFLVLKDAIDCLSPLVPGFLTGYFRNTKSDSIIFVFIFFYSRAGADIYHHFLHFGRSHKIFIMKNAFHLFNAEKPSCEIHPLGIGGKADPVRLVFTAPAGAAVNAAIIDLGDRFRLLLNEVDVVAPPQPLPKLPVARAFWKPRPDLKTAAAAWIYAGGPHHTVLSQAVTTRADRGFCRNPGHRVLED